MTFAYLICLTTTSINQQIQKTKIIGHSYIYINNTINNVEVVDLNLTTMSYLNIRFPLEVGNFTGYTIYRSPNSIANKYLVELEHTILVRTANKNSYSSIIVGDINIDTLSCNDLSQNYL